MNTQRGSISVKAVHHPAPVSRKVTLVSAEQEGWAWERRRDLAPGKGKVPWHWAIPGRNQCRKPHGLLGFPSSCLASQYAVTFLYMRNQGNPIPRCAVLWHWASSPNPDLTLTGIKAALTSSEQLQTQNGVTTIRIRPSVIPGMRLCFPPSLPPLFSAVCKIIH